MRLPCFFREILASRVPRHHGGVVEELHLDMPGLECEREPCLEPGLHAVLIETLAKQTAG